MGKFGGNVRFLSLRFPFCDSMSSTAENNQWKYMEEMCILVDENDHQVGADTKKNCKGYLASFDGRSSDR